MVRLSPPLWFAAALLLSGCAHYSPPRGAEALSAAEAEPAERAPAPLPDTAGPTGLIRYTLSHHPQLQAAEQELSAARAQVDVAGGLPDPELSLGLGEMRQRVALQQRIPLFGKRRLAAEAAHYRAEAAAARRDELRLELTQTLVERYADYAFVLASQTIVAEQLELLEQLAEVVRTRYRSGAASQADSLRLDNERDRLRSERHSLDDNARAAAAQLNAALGRPVGSELPRLMPLEPRWLEPTPERETEWPSEREAHEHLELVQRSPQLQVLEYQLMTQELEQGLAERAGRPDLMVGLEHMQDDAMGSDTSLMLGINLPIWRGRYAAERSGAEAGYAALAARYQDLEQQLQAQLTQALFRWRESERNRELYGETLNRRAEQAVAAARRAYSSGDGSFTDLIDSQRQWLAFQLNYQRALAEGLKWRVRVDTITGREPTIDSGEGDRHE